MTCSKNSAWSHLTNNPPLELIQGLRLFPWVTQHKAELVDKNALHAETFYDCAKCIYSQEDRANFRCAYVPALERTGRALVPPDYPYEDPDVCGGYLANLPAVIETARACSWRRDGELSMFYPDGITEMVKLAIDIMSSEFKAVEQHQIRKSRED